MHDITLQLTAFLEKVGTDKASTVPEALIEEFGERCKAALRECLLERKKEGFRLRMSNVGRSLRQLMLEKLYGRVALTPATKIRMVYGYMAESLMVFLLKASGCAVEELDKEVKYSYNGQEIQGKYDIKIDGKIYDIKSASNYSFTQKFRDAYSLRKDDSFGYFAQGFGYAEAENEKFGGWIVLDKSSGDYKVVPIPGITYAELRKESVDEIHYKMDYLSNPEAELPPCTGIGVSKTGKATMTTECRFCDFKNEVCHPKEQ